MLLKADSNLEAKDKKKNTPLVRAAANAHHNNVRLLLERGVDINERTGQLGNALQVASLSKNKILINNLLDQGGRRQCVGRRIWQRAAGSFVGWKRGRRDAAHKKGGGHQCA